MLYHLKFQSQNVCVLKGCNVSTGTIEEHANTRFSASFASQPARTRSGRCRLGLTFSLPFIRCAAVQGEAMAGKVIVFWQSGGAPAHGAEFQMGRVSQKFNFNWYVASVWCRVYERSISQPLCFPILRDIRESTRNEFSKIRDKTG